MITSFQDVLSATLHLLGDIVPLLFLVALFYFIWGLVGYIVKSGDEKAKAEGKWKMIWGAIGLFEMISVWGIVQIVQGELFGDSSVPAGIPVIHKTLP